jgi:thiamine-phosphate pyrophosphorylase
MVPVTGTRLFIIVEASIEGRALESLVASGDSAVVLFAPLPGGSLEPARLKPLVEIAQAKGAAALVEADAKLARTLRADGVHLPWSKDVVARYREARESLGQRFIVGADAGRLRDDAMTLGEAGADYVGFGIPPHVSDRETARERRLELVAWWSEIFEVPCVAFDVETLEEAATLARAGADFVALAMPPDAEPSRWVREAADALGAREDVA